MLRLEARGEGGEGDIPFYFLSCIVIFLFAFMHTVKVFCLFVGLILFPIIKRCKGSIEHGVSSYLSQVLSQMLHDGIS